MTSALTPLSANGLERHFQGQRLLTACIVQALLGLVIFEIIWAHHLGASQITALAIPIVLFLIKGWGLGELGIWTWVLGHPSLSLTAGLFVWPMFLCLLFISFFRVTGGLGTGLLRGWARRVHIVLGLVVILEICLCLALIACVFILLRTMGPIAHA